MNPVEGEENVFSFYKNCTVLVTGTTGFLGKVIVEKIIRTCENIEEVYILLKSKKGISFEQRYDDLLKSMAFDAIRSKNPKLLQKIKPIKGDVTEEDLGLSQNDQKLLMERVNIVIHSAATVKFNEPLDFALNLNAIGTKRLLDLSCKFKKLKSFVYISTAYSNCDIFDVQEKVYPSPYDPVGLQQYLISMPKDMLDRKSLSIRGGHPNSYTFTKNLAETVILKYFGKIPVCIVRPSIIMASVSEPFEGWIDNIRGVGVFSEIYRGTIRTALSIDGMITDYIPVDMVANTCITAAWHHRLIQKDDIIVYNCTTGDVVKTSWQDACKIAVEIGRSHPSKYLAFYPNFTTTTHRFINSFWRVFVHLLAAFLLDIFLRIQGKKPMVLKISRFVDSNLTALEYFTLHQWNFCTGNFHKLQKMLVKTKDDVNFPCDITRYDWKDVLKIHLLGVRKYILKDSMDSLPAAKIKLQRY